MVFVHTLRQVLVLWPRLAENAGESEAQDAALDEHGIQLASWLSLSPPMGLAGRTPHTALLFALGSSARDVMGTVRVHGLRQLQRHTSPLNLRRRFKRRPAHSAEEVGR